MSHILRVVIASAKTPFLLFVSFVVTASALSAQTIKTLINFDGNSATAPAYATLVQGIDGNLYGTTYYGGSGDCDDFIGVGCGVVFKVSKDGALEILHNFAGNDGQYPQDGLVLGNDGKLYGTTFEGGSARLGTVFSITYSGLLTTIHNFSGPDGSAPYAGLTLGQDGNFYGVTFWGGAGYQFCTEGCGTVFKMSAAGELTTLYNFCSQIYCPDGTQPRGRLALGLDGALYGTTSGGSLYQSGTVFRISEQGTLRTIHIFGTPFLDGLIPLGGLVQSSDGNLYGTTQKGGYEGVGTIYELTPREGYKTFAFFNTDTGFYPAAPLVEGSDGNLYGTLQFGPTGSSGSVYEANSQGSIKVLHFFAGYPRDGAQPLGGLFQATDGNFYGVTYAGGSGECNYSAPGCGTVFSLNMDLGPFVSFVKPFGRVGLAAGILGQGLTGTTAVSLNGTPMSFTVESDTFIKAKVPTGATTGYITVDTPSGKLSSNVPFQIIK